MEIQRLSAVEGTRLRAIRLRALRDAPDAFGTTFEEAAAFPAETWAAQIEALATFIAVGEGADVGMVRGAPDEQRSDVSWLISMWVAPEVRGQGAGEALIAALAQWARSRGSVELRLDVADQNAPAIGLYARSGFEPNGVRGTLPSPRTHIREHQRVLQLA